MVSDCGRRRGHVRGGSDILANAAAGHGSGAVHLAGISARTLCLCRFHPLRHPGPSLRAARIGRGSSPSSAGLRSSPPLLSWLLRRSSRSAIVWATATAAAAALDASIARLPDNIVLPGAATVFAMAVMADRWAVALLGALLLAGPMLIVHLVRPEGFGFGDVKFGLLLGLGLRAVAVSLVVVAYIGASLLHAGAWAAPDAGTGFCPSARRWPSPQRRR